MNWEDRCEGLLNKKEKGGYLMGIGNIFSALVTAFWYCLGISFIVLLLWLLFRQHTEIDGHDYVRSGAYNFAHSPECWCEK